MGLLNRLKDFRLNRGTTANTDFVPYDHKGWIVDMSLFGNSPEFSNIATPEGQALAYRIVRDVRMIINKKSSVFRNGKVWVLDDTGGEPDTREAKEARKLLANPNPLQTWADFYVQQKIYKYIFGFCPVYRLRSIGTNTIHALYNILPLIFEINYKKGSLVHQTLLENIIESYKITYDGDESILDLNDVYVSKDISVNFDTNSLLPESRLSALQYDAAVVRALGMARFQIIDRRGALGILSNESKDSVGSIAMDPEEKENVQREFQRAYGITNDRNHVIITNANLKWQQMGISTKELMLLELGDDAKIQIADMYDYPSSLLGFKEGVTYQNRLEAKKELYQDSVIPDSIADQEDLTRFLDLQNCKVTIDFSEVAALQEDRELKARTLDTTISALDKAMARSIITPYEYRKELAEIININPDKYATGPETNNTVSD